MTKKNVGGKPTAGAKKAAAKINKIGGNLQRQTSGNVDAWASFDKNGKMSARAFGPGDPSPFAKIKGNNRNLGSSVGKAIGKSMDSRNK